MRMIREERHGMDFRLRREKNSTGDRQEKADWFRFEKKNTHRHRGIDYLFIPQNSIDLWSVWSILKKKEESHPHSNLSVASDATDVDDSRLIPRMLLTDGNYRWYSSAALCECAYLNNIYKICKTRSAEEKGKIIRIRHHHQILTSDRSSHQWIRATSSGTNNRSRQLLPFEEKDGACSRPLFFRKIVLSAERNWQEWFAGVE